MINKAKARAHYLSIRNALASSEVLGLSAEIAKRLFELCEYERVASVMAYADIGNEVATGGIICRILADEKRLYLPRVAESGLETVRITNPKKQLRSGTFGVNEPAPDLSAVPLGEIDLVLVPGIAFDVAGNRIGYGKGYYDRFLPNTACPAIGLAFEAQIAKVLPYDTNDKKIKIIVTEKRVIRV